MALHLLTPGPLHRQVTSASENVVLEATGPAVVFAADDRADIVGGIPVCFRAPSGTWTEVGYEAADHWVALGPELRTRLIDDPSAPLSVTEFKAATGASAAMITSNWVRSGSPLRYRAAGQLRELAEVLGACFQCSA